MKQHLLSAGFVLGLIGQVLFGAGCVSKPATIPSLTAVPGNGFIKQWEANLGIGRNERIKELYVRESAVVAYTNSNTGYWLTPSGGGMMAINKITDSGYRVYPPVALGEHLVIPTTTTLESYDKAGHPVDSYQFPSAVQSPAAGAGDTLYLGVSRGGGGGRLAKFVVGDKLVRDWELYTSQGLIASPAVFGDDVYAGGVDGKVLAVNSDRAALWAIPNNVFVTSGSISGNLAADDYGVYVASQDRTLYCLDKLSGKLKWSYHAPAALIEGPTVIGNVVYQFVPNVGLVAINKVEGNLAREPIWTQPNAQQILAADDKYLYVRFGSNIIVALDLASGEPKFHSTRSDMTVFATNLLTPIIYAATQQGSVLAVRPVLKPGTVGEIVLNTLSPRDAMVAAQW